MSVEGGGCSGFQYKLDLEEGELSLGAEDVVVEREGARVVVDQTSLEYLQVGPPHLIIVKLREREGRRVDLGRSLKGHL